VTSQEETLTPALATDNDIFWFMTTPLSPSVVEQTAEALHQSKVSVIFSVT